ncbi:G-protein coupled receptor dmsr-1-like [Mya arenaria]|uniref:G-protein coupled receptor dmsr-1-like n=1 Tax=Mya arenaria TaxID=6604 RepID=UPI0022DFB7D9|nr:G-protein coupled receptor dmsr-1-like [Mya arenaria]
MNTTTPKPFLYEPNVQNKDLLDTLSTWYGHIHGYVSLVICVFGVSLNIFNVIVLTRKKLKTPINFILTSLAVSDMATMISYIPFAFHFYCHFSANSISAGKNSQGWMNFLLVYLNFSATTHTISIWLAVALAIFRHHHVHSPAKGNLTRTRRIIRARIVVFIIFIASVITMVPYYACHNLTEVRFHENKTGFVFEPWHLGTGHEKLVIFVSLILYSCLAKLVPCVLIIIYGTLLLITLNNTRMKSRIRRSENGILTDHPPQRVIDMSRTTIMLLVVIVLFLFSELPQGVLIMCCLFQENFFETVYIPLGDVMDIIALINSSINFVLYCTMSQEFRHTFTRLFCNSWQFKRHQRPVLVPQELTQRQRYVISEREPTVTDL